MTHSTPIQQKILNKSRNVMSPLRRSLGPISTPVLDHTNDDESERNTARSRAEVARSVSKVNSSVEDNQEVHAHLETCIQLFAENKINMKNVWNLRLIDYMRLALQMPRGNLGETLKLASTSLDVGSKIYGLRVDDVHNEVMKLADEMTRAEPAKPAAAGDADAAADADAAPAGENSGDEDGDARPAPKQRKKSRRADANISSEEPLDGPLSRTDEAYTSMLLRRGDANVPVNLVLPTACGTYTALVPSRASALTLWHEAEPPADPKPLECPLPALSPEKFSVICPSFADFAADDTSIQSLLQMSSHSLDNEVVYDADGVPIPEYTPVPAPPAYEHSDYESGAEDEPPGNTEVVHVQDMRPEFSRDSHLEYSFRAAVPVTSERYGIVGAWAGPAHWKVKQLKKPRGSPASAERQSAARGPRVVLAPIDLNAERPRTPPLARSTRVTTRRTKQHDSFKTLIPEDLGVAKYVVNELILKPGAVVKCLSGSTSQPPGPHSESDSQAQPFNTSVLYEYNNEEDVQYCRRVPPDGPGWVDADQCPADDGAPDWDADADVATDADADLGSRKCSQTITGGDLLTEPDLVVPNTVQYATHAKKINMKALKASMWSMVEAGYEQPQGLPFAHIYERLEAELPSTTVAELTVPLAFVSLLHLVNEHNLKILGTAALDDISISKG